MKKLVVALFIITSTFQVFSQGNQSATLSFKEAVKIAVENNITLKQQKNLLVASKINTASGLASMGPNLSLSGNLGRNDGNSFNQQRGEVVNGVIDFLSGSFNANMTVFNGFSQLNAYKQSRYQLESQLSNVKRTNQDIIQLVSTQYLQCLLDVELLKIDEKNLVTQQTQLDKITEEVSVGSRAKVDQISQEFQVKNAALTVLRSKNRLRNDKVILAQTLQLDPSSDFTLENPEWDVNRIDTKELDLNQLYTTALSKRADLQGARHDEKSSRFGYRSMQGTYYPSIGAFFSYGSRYNFVQGFEDNRSFDQQFREDNVQTTYGLSINVPIFNGLRSRSAVALSKASYENSVLQAQNMEVQVKSDVLLAYQNLRDAVTSYNASQSQLESAKLTYELETDRYNLSASDLVQYTQATQDYVRAQGDLARDTYTLLFQDILLNYALGTLTFEDLP